MARLLVGRGNKSPAKSPSSDESLPTTHTHTHTQQQQQRRTAAEPKVHASPSSGFCSRQAFMMLVVGVLAGYVILPIFLIESKLGDAFDRLPSNQKAAGNSDRNLLDGTSALQRLMEDRDIMTKQSLPTSTTPYIMHTQTLPDHQRKKILVTGGAGFVGSHLVDKLMMEGHEVTVVDNFFTGQKKNIAHWLHHPNFRCVFMFVC